MGRLVGSASTSTIEFRNEYDKRIAKYGDPIEVLFKMLKSRKQSVKFAAAKELLTYRFPKQASIQAQVEQAGQLVMSWDETIDLPPENVIELEVIPNDEQ